MNPKIAIELKPEVKPIPPAMLEEMKPYRIVSVRDQFPEAELRDIVLRFPSRTGGQFILNCTRGMMFFDRSQRDQYGSDFLCLRAFDVRSISFCHDGEDKPQ